MQKGHLIIVFLIHSMFLQAQNTTWLNSISKRTNSRETAVIMYENKTIDENSFSIYESKLNNGDWSDPTVKWIVSKKTDRTWYIYDNKQHKNNYRILEIIDTLSVGYKIKQTNHDNKVLLISDVIQLFPVIPHGKSTLFDNEGLPMAEYSYNMGAILNEALVFNSLDTNIVITQPPVFRGGSTGFRTEIAKTIKYPVAAQEKNLQDEVYVKFLIDIDGQIRKVSAVGNVKNELTKEGVRVISSIRTKWEPALSNGIKIPVWYYAKFNWKQF